MPPRKNCPKIKACVKTNSHHRDVFTHVNTRQQQLARNGHVGGQSRRKSTCSTLVALQHQHRRATSAHNSGSCSFESQFSSWPVADDLPQIPTMVGSKLLSWKPNKSPSPVNSNRLLVLTAKYQCCVCNMYHIYHALSYKIFIKLE